VVSPPEVELEGSQAGPESVPRKAVVIDLRQLVDEGNLELNAEVVGGDIITVPARAQEYVFVLGYVQKPGAYEIRDTMKVDALRAVALAGGLAPSARAENSVLIRETAEGQDVVPLDLTKMARGVRPPLYIEPGDTLVVGSSFFGRLSEFVRPSIGAGMNMTP
jgi:protein involved in polysaccharide export with SLBB domain